MFDLSFGEILVIGFVIVLFVKPEEVPGIMRAIGKGLGKLRNLSNELAKALEDATRDGNGKSLKQELREVIDLKGNLQHAYDIAELEEFYEARSPEPITALPKPKKKTAVRRTVKKPVIKSKQKAKTTAKPKKPAVKKATVKKGAK